MRYPHGSTLKMQVSIGVPASLRFDHWTLGLKQFSFHHISQSLRVRLGYTNFASPSLSQQAMLTVEFPLRLSWVDL